MWLLDLFKKKKEPVVMQTTIKMGELILNPSAPERQKRHASRIQTLNEALKSVRPNTEEAISLQKELKRRQLEMQLEELKGGK